MAHDRHVIIGLALVLGLLFVVSFGSLTITSFTTVPVGKTPSDFRTPILVLLVVACAVILIYVYNQRKKVNF